MGISNIFARVSPRFRDKRQVQKNARRAGWVTKAELDEGIAGDTKDILNPDDPSREG